MSAASISARSMVTLPSYATSAWVTVARWIFDLKTLRRMMRRVVAANEGPPDGPLQHKSDPRGVNTLVFAAVLTRVRREPSRLFLSRSWPRYLGCFSALGMPTRSPAELHEILKA